MKHNKHFIIFLAPMQKAVETAVGKTLKRPPLNSCGRYYELYLPKDIITDTNQYKLVDLNFKIIVPENITSHIISNTLLKQQQLEITSKYKEATIKLINKTQLFSFKFPKNTEIARLYFFTSPGEKNHTLYKLEYGRPF